MKPFLKWIRPLHRYVGVALALFLLVLAISGGVLVYEDDLWRLRYPVLAEPLQTSTAAEQAAALSAIGTMFHGTVQKVSFPRSEIHAYRIRFAGGEAFVHPITHDLIAQWHWYGTPLGFIRELHIRLAAGSTGQRVAGTVGLLAVLMVISGILLWWPLRRRFRLRHVVPRRVDRQAFLSLHRDLGVAASPVIFLLVLTGAGLVFYPTAKDVLNAAFSDKPSIEPNPVVVTEQAVVAPTAEILTAAQAALPQAQLMSYKPPQRGNGVYSFRFKQPGEWHPYGRSVVYVDHITERVIVAVDATLQPLGERIAYSIHPLHSARFGSRLYQIIVLIGAIALAAISSSGAITFVQLQRRSRDARSRTVRS